VRRSILASLLIMGAVAAILVTVTIANFSDSETSTGNTVAAGTLDLQVNGHDDPVPAVCNVGPLKEDDEVYCGPIQVSNVGSLPGIADIHFVSATCSEGENPESETPAGVCNMDHDLSVDVIYDETVDGECSGCGDHPTCDCLCEKCAGGSEYYCNKAEEKGCECGGPPPTVVVPDGETTYLEPTPLDEVLSKQINLGLLEPGETDEICISFDVSGLTNEDQGDIVTMPIEFTLHEPD
jgi:predicted ribosomally synthesized peptide with SipW-like signal peptide